MLHHLLLIQLKSEAREKKVEDLMVETRMRLLKIPEILNLQCGKRIDKTNPHDFFVAMDLENRSKLKAAEDDPIYLQFKHQVLDPHAKEVLTLDYEMEPGKDVNYS